ncbi:TPA: endolytic transglycosylase MltG [candidate division CPR2 bacterium]|uniref:Endolytic murein transglycosylase n=1 Tax=candidate division CPR2 bacterium GW2011_GWC1_41_48 TaxID=1618344 RepID=A0A0G0Z6Z7_UNCC2|nr:MAG: YceG family protein [candidate division CPR2 bacterium GW2011_GWC2_39_35]KKR27835.1 MAG: YceG family protein [candidate division CPR2 bacterium GW2011_GWD2_39_7]KKR27984.1 MAG: YceG family protein [candidate division CPR2 bacterium GW2011_GWD1_39_7]KKS08798.1 MAG: YceG family protein [candidate division CPR2 bacterium GW2011_GWC1_41_48]OGB60242.1 MAG: hypothetical protein A2Y27_01390 [candidate division CPR2 bacterium GWD1_39_7]OGB71911.1 MAG: hypothetical protein A2Y26_02070 [candidat
MKKKIIAGIIILFFMLALLAGSLFAWYDLSLNKKSGSHELVKFSISEGEKTTQIGKRLKDQGIISDYLVFIAYIKLEHLTLKAGDYEFSKSNPMKDIVDKIAKGDVKTHRITVKEGWSLEGIAKYLEEEKKLFKTGEFNKALGYEYNYSFLRGKNGKENLEGFLFPDTYELNAKSTAYDLIDMMLKNMESRLTSEVKEGFTKQGLSVKEGVILASVVELEGQKEEDRKLIAGILLERLKSGMRLEADATVRYVINDWNKKLTIDDLSIDSPYNTRLNEGLPPGAICNPGEVSLKAVANPTESDYLYYLSEKNGTMHYASTSEEHNVNVGQYLNY